MEQYADLVKVHYQYYLNKETYKKHIPSNFKELKGYTDIDSMVFEDKRNDEIVVAMRGVKLFSPRDILIGTEMFFEDAYQQGGGSFKTATAKKKGISFLPNKYGEILMNEQNKIEELKSKSPSKKIILSGHSRGGRKAIDLGEYNQMEYHAFQPAELSGYGHMALGLGVGLLTPEFAIPTGLSTGLLSSSIGSNDYATVLKKLVNKNENKEREALTEGIANIYKTKDDKVSRGWKHTELVDAKKYAYGVFDNAIGDHTIDHFISKEMFDSVKQLNEGRPTIETETSSLEDTFSPVTEIQPSVSRGYTVNNEDLCRRYPTYSNQCKYILR